MQTTRTFFSFSSQFVHGWPPLGWTAFDEEQQSDLAATREREGRERARSVCL